MKTPTKIIHVNLAKSFRGGEIQTVELVRALHAYGVSQEVVCRKNSPMAMHLQQWPGVRVSQVSGPLAGHMGREAESAGAIVHAHEARAVYWAWIEKCLRSTPYVVTRRVINRLSGSCITRKAYRSADALIAVSAYAAHVLALAVNRSIGVVMDACRALPASPDDAEKLVLSGSPRIGHIGEFDDAVKGQGLLIEAFLQVLNVYPDARLYLLGDGKDREKFAHQYRYEDRIVFVGAVKNVREWLSQWDVFCFPSRMEALGSSVLEAMSMGVPVIVSDAGGIPELVGNQERGLVVPERTSAAWAISIMHALNDSENTQNRAWRAQVFASQNNAAHMAEQYWKIYSGLLS